MDKKMKVIPKPKEGTRTVFEKKGNNEKIPPFIKGTGDLYLLCGYCETVLCESVNSGQIRGIVFKCPVCNNYNDTQ